MEKFTLIILFFALAICRLSGQQTTKFDEMIQVSKDHPEVFDLRESEVLSAVKTQPTGGCWTSAANASIESFWRKSGFGDYILSDRNVQLFSGFDTDRRTNGNRYMITAVYSRRDGPLLKNPVTDTIPVKNPILPAILEGARYLPDSADLIKTVIRKFGGVFSMLYLTKSTGLDTLTNVYYSPKNKINHVVCLVGWNDTLATEWGRGAWIAQNSLGPNYGDNGFVYIPYQDKNILTENAVWPQWKTYSPKSHLYYYDTLGTYLSYGFGNPLSYGMVKFTAAEDGRLTRVSSFTNYPNTTLQTFIYKDFDTATKALSGLVDSTDNVQCRFAGYYAIDLPEMIPLKKGEDIYVVMKYYVPGAKIPMPVEKYVKGYCEPHIQTKKCWMNPDIRKWPNTWYECGMEAENPDLQLDLCIRAEIIED